MASYSYAPASSNIERVDFDDSTDTLTITFQGGAEYDYINVPVSVYRQMQASPSAGQFFHRQIKGRYQFDGPK